MNNFKFKIALTNISRIIISVIFINLSSVVFKMNRAFGTTINIDLDSITCYAVGPSMSPWEKTINFFQENVFILIVPIILLVLLIIFLIKKIKETIKINKEVKRRMEERHDRKD